MYVTDRIANLHTNTTMSMADMTPQLPCLLVLCGLKVYKHDCLISTVVNSSVIITTADNFYYICFFVFFSEKIWFDISFVNHLQFT